MPKKAKDRRYSYYTQKDTVCTEEQMPFPGMAVTLWMALTKARVPKQFAVSAIVCNRGQSRADAETD